jgi:predicted component of type VI protein secretion system
MVLRDLDNFKGQSIRDVAEVRRWLERTIASYEAWLKRLAVEKAGP